MRDTVVLLPGLQSDHRSWVYQIAYFQEKYNILVPQNYHSNDTIAGMGDAICQQLPARFHFVAWSMGGYIALQMIPKIQERLISLTLVSTSAMPEDPANTARRLENLALAEQEGMAAANHRSLTFSCLDINAVPAGKREGLKQAAVELGVPAYRAQQHAIIDRPDGRTILKQIDCPTLVVVGDGDKVTPIDRAQDIHKAIEGSRLVIINDCGHCPPLEHPRRINNLFENWFLESQ